MIKHISFLNDIKHCPEVSKKYYSNQRLALKIFLAHWKINELTITLSIFLIFF